MSKTISARIPDSLHDMLREYCSTQGCTINVLLVKQIEKALDNNSSDNISNVKSIDQKEGFAIKNVKPKVVIEL